MRTTATAIFFLLAAPLTLVACGPSDDNHIGPDMAMAGGGEDDMSMEMPGDMRMQLPADMVVAGKTGTSDDLRDSWFAGFTNDHLIVTWIGTDDNKPTGLTGSSGAARIWAGVLRALEASSYTAPAPDTVADEWIDYLTGQPMAEHCENAVAIPVPADQPIEHAFGCNGETGFGARIKSWFRGDGR